MENKKYKIKWTDNIVVHYLLAIVLIFAGQLLGSLIVGLPFDAYFGIKALKTNRDYFTVASEFVPSAALKTALMYLAPIGSWVVVLLAFRIKRNRPMFTTFKTKIKGNTPLLFLFGLVLGFGLNALCVLVAFLHGDISLTFDSFKPISFIIILLCVLVQSSSEEILCRGYLYQKLIHRYKKPVVAIVGNSALFAILHIFNSGVTPLALMNILLAGLLFSLLVYYFDSMWAAFAAHTAWNFTQNILFGLPNSGQMVPYSVFKLDEATATNSFAYDVPFGVEGTLLAVIVLAIACLVLYLIGKKKGLAPTNIWAEYDAALEAEAAKTVIEAEEPSPVEDKPVE